MDFFHSAFFSQRARAACLLSLLLAVVWNLTLSHGYRYDWPCFIAYIMIRLLGRRCGTERCVVFQSIASEMLFCVFSFDYAPHSLFINRARVNICVSHSRTYKRTQMSSVDKTRRWIRLKITNNAAAMDAFRWFSLIHRRARRTERTLHYS